MAWQRFIGSALVVFSLVPAGCESTSHTLARDQFLEDPEMMSAIRDNAWQAPDITRGQKPDLRPPSSLLDVPPERPADGSYGQRAASILATVDGVAILDEEVRASAYGELMRASQLAEPERSRRVAEVINDTLNSIIERELVLKEMFDLLHKNANGKNTLTNKIEVAAREAFESQILKPLKTSNHLKTEEEVKRFLLEQGVTFYHVRRQWERNWMEMEYLRQRVFPLLETRINHQKIADYYDSHPEEFQVADSVEWQDLFVAAAKYPSRAEARAFAESLAQQAREGADFPKLVKEHDDGDSTLRGGAGVGTKHGEIKPPEAEESVFALTDGKVGSLIELPAGFHIIKVVQRQQAGRKPFDDKVQKQIRVKLQNDVFRAEIKRIVANLKSKAVIEIAKKSP